MEYMEELHAVVERWKRDAVQAGLERGREEGLERGLERGREEGLERGREEGLERGREDSLRHSLFTVYRARFGQEPPALAHALNTAGTDALDRWLSLFATGTSDEILRAVQKR